MSTLQPLLSYVDLNIHLVSYHFRGVTVMVSLHIARRIQPCLSTFVKGAGKACWHRLQAYNLIYEDRIRQESQPGVIKLFAM